MLDEVSVRLSAALRRDASAAQLASSINVATSQMRGARAELESFDVSAKPHVLSMQTAAMRVGASAYDMMAFSHASDQYVARVCSYDEAGDMYYK